MGKETAVELTFMGGMLFQGRSAVSGRTVEADFAGPGATPAGFMPTELLLISLASCSGQVILGLLERMGQKVEGLTVSAKGSKSEVHPKVFTSIELIFAFKGGRMDAASAQKAVFLSEERFCPVWAMLKAGVPITARFTIE